MLNTDNEFDVRNDWVKMYEEDNDVLVNEAFCGTNYPAQIIANSTRMVVAFHSDEYGTEQGFRIKIETGSISKSKRNYLELKYLIDIFIICAVTLKLS